MVFSKLANMLFCYAFEKGEYPKRGRKTNKQTKTEFRRLRYAM